MRTPLWIALTLVTACGDPISPLDEDSPGGGSSRGELPVGAPCSSDDDCVSSLCLREDAALFGSGGPPGGLCSLDCSGDSSCPAGSTCVETSAGLRCLETCEFGADSQKCSTTSSCEPFLRPTGAGCSNDAECEEGALCFAADGEEESEGTCERVEGVCRPRCRTDGDCSAGRFCDRGAGTCSEEPADGARFGESCLNDSKVCRGRCVQVNDDKYECEERCRIGDETSCDEGPDSPHAAVCGFFAFDLSALSIEQGTGDTGICARFCGCNGDCPGSQLCLPRATEQARGLCIGGIPPESSLPCDDEGEDGGGGAPP